MTAFISLAPSIVWLVSVRVLFGNVVKRLKDCPLYWGLDLVVKLKVKDI